MSRIWIEGCRFLFQWFIIWGIISEYHQYKLNCREKRATRTKSFSASFSIILLEVRLSRSSQFNSIFISAYGFNIYRRISLGFGFATTWLDDYRPCNISAITFSTTHKLFKFSLSLNMGDVSRFCQNSNH